MAQESILVLDCGGADTVHIARTVRGLGVYSEIVEASRGFEGFAGRNPAGLIALGEPCSLDIPPVLLASGVPILALGGASRALLRAAGGSVGPVTVDGTVLDLGFEKSSALFSGAQGGMRRVERAHALTLPDGYRSVSGEGDTPLAFADEGKHIYGLQFQIERNDMDGYQILSNFVKDICGCDGLWSVSAYLETAVEGLRNRVGEGIAICPMTGGVDTAVCAALSHRALGGRVRCVLVDTGLMAQGEGEGIERAFVEQMEVPLRRVQADGRFLGMLRGVRDPAEKNRIVAAEFSRVVSEQALDIRDREIFLLRGTIYNDVLGGIRSQATAGVPASWTVLEPLRGLFKHEVRELGKSLGMPEKIAERQPFPGAGLAVRCIGEATPERIATLRETDALLKQMIEENGAQKGLAQYFAVLSDLSTLCSDGARAGETAILRAVRHKGGLIQAARLPHDLLESIVEAILREIPQITRVLYDVTPGPPAAVELE